MCLTDFMWVLLWCHKMLPRFFTWVIGAEIYDRVLFIFQCFFYYLPYKHSCFLWMARNRLFPTGFVDCQFVEPRCWVVWICYGCMKWGPYWPGTFMQYGNDSLISPLKVFIWSVQCGSSWRCNMEISTHKGVFKERHSPHFQFKIGHSWTYHDIKGG